MYQVVDIIVSHKNRKKKKKMIKLSPLLVYTQKYIKVEVNLFKKNNEQTLLNTYLYNF